MRKAIAITYSDLHLEKYKQFNEGNRRVKNAIDVIRQTRLKAKELGNLVSLFVGDLYHKEQALTNDILDLTLPELSKYFKSVKYRTIAISGNHDQSRQNLIGNESPSYVKTLSKIFEGFDCIDFKSEEFKKGFHVHGVPYITHDIGLIDWINKIELGKGKNILMLHTTMPGAKDTDDREIDAHIELNDFNKAISRFDLVLCGHIHKPFEYKVGKTRVVQVGAPQQQRLTDKDCKMGYWIIYDDMTVEFVHLKKYPTFKEVTDPKFKINTTDFWVIKTKPKELKVNVEVNKNKFSTNNNKTSLAKNYIKQKGIEDKQKEKSLINVLKQVE